MGFTPENGMLGRRAIRVPGNLTERIDCDRGTVRATGQRAQISDGINLSYRGRGEQAKPKGRQNSEPRDNCCFHLILRSVSGTLAAAGLAIELRFVIGT